MVVLYLAVIKKELLRKLSSFVLVGIVGAVVDFSIRSLLLHFGLPGTLARAGSYISGSTVAYYLNSYFTFNGVRSREEKLKATASYVACFLTAVAVDYAMRRVFGESGSALFWSWFFSQAAATSLNFLLQNMWVFRKREA